jgi:hypothetical protein
MFLKKFIKQQFIAYYYDENYKLLSQIYKNKNLLEEASFEFENKKDLLKKIKELAEDIPQTYTSTIIQTLNQGVIKGCTKADFQKYGIEVENIKYVCIDNKYSIYTSLYDLMDLKKLEIDFIYSVFALIDYKVSARVNTLYILVTKEKFYILIYHNKIPIYSDIFEKAEELIENNDLDLDDINDGEVIEIDEDVIEDLDAVDDIDDIEEVEESQEEIKTGIEMDVVNFIKESIEEYYKNYSEDFIEKIVILDNGILNDDVVKIIDDTLFIEAKKEEFDILKTMNEMSREYV